MLLKEIDINEENIGFLPSLGISFQLNETGKEIINKIKEGKSKDEIVEELAEEYKKDYKEIYLDVQDFYQKLKVYGLL